MLERKFPIKGSTQKAAENAAGQEIAEQTFLATSADWEARLAEARAKRQKILAARPRKDAEPRLVRADAVPPELAAMVDLSAVQPPSVAAILDPEMPAPASVDRPVPIPAEAAPAQGEAPAAESPTRAPLTKKIAFPVSAAAAFALGLGLGLPLAAAIVWLGQTGQDNATTAVAPREVPVAMITTTASPPEPDIVRASTAPTLARPEAPAEMPPVTPVLAAASPLPTSVVPRPVETASPAPVQQSQSFAAIAPSAETVLSPETQAVEAPPFAGEEAETSALLPENATVIDAVEAPQPLEEDPVGESPLAAFDGEFRLFLPRHAASERGSEIGNTLSEAGGDLHGPVRTSATIRTTHIRYFHPEDASLARAAATEIGAQARDFTAFSPTPPRGQLEIWIAGQGASSGSGNGGSQNGVAAAAREFGGAVSRLLRSIPPSDPH